MTLHDAEPIITAINRQHDHWLDVAARHHADGRDIETAAAIACAKAVRLTRDAVVRATLESAHV